MKFTSSFINCEEGTVTTLSKVLEIFSIISKVPWQASRVEAVSRTDKTVYWQEAYNRLFDIEFDKQQWDSQPTISQSPLHKADFAKNKIFVEIQFGNSSTVYRDFYKFHLGFSRKVLDLGVLIVPTDQYAFFPERPRESVGNMATYEYALEHFEAIPLHVPILLIGLLPEN